MKNNTKNKAMVIIMGIFLLVFSVYTWLKPINKYSESERRFLKEFPKISVETVKNGNFQKEFEEYTLDQFPFRDYYRGIKNGSALYLFQQSDIHHLYLQDGYIAKIEYPLKKPMIDHAINKFNKIYDTYLKNTDVPIYFSVVPDKNYLLAEKSQKLKMDYSGLIVMMKKELPYMKYIDLFPLVKIEDYYYTDTHWKQEKILKIAEKLASEMNTEIEKEYEIKQVEKDFHGVYYGQLFLPIKPDKLEYMVSPTLEKCQVTSYNTGKPLKAEMYDLSKIESKDPYEMYLGGNNALLTIENPSATTDKELVVFRDSFAGAISPLLATGYKKVTLVDIRYIHPKLIGSFIDFKNQDVLFLYSTIVLNSSTSFK